MRSALLISTYNWPEALNLILKSVLNQTQLPDEILIADDGSDNRTKALIERYQEIFKIPLRHFWHEDDGFRKSIILNRALANSEADYIIQIDGDCIIHKNFVMDHLKLASKNTYLYGSRVNIKEEFLPELFKNEVASFNFYAPGIRNRTRNLRIPLLSRLYFPRTSISSKLRGCNVSYWRSDFIDINGYNEDMMGWGREDSEMIVRMMNKGVKAKRIRYRGIVYHIWHKVKSKARLNINDQIQKEAIEQKIVRCTNGIDKYLNEN